MQDRRRSATPARDTIYTDYILYKTEQWALERAGANGEGDRAKCEGDPRARFLNRSVSCGQNAWHREQINI